MVTSPIPGQKPAIPFSYKQIRLRKLTKKYCPRVRRTPTGDSFGELVEGELLDCLYFASRCLSGQYDNQGTFLVSPKRKV